MFSIATNGFPVVNRTELYTHAHKTISETNVTVVLFFFGILRAAKAYLMRLNARAYKTYKRLRRLSVVYTN